MPISYYLLALASLVALIAGGWALVHGAWLQASTMGAIALYLILQSIGVRWNASAHHSQRPPALEAGIWLSAGLALLLVIINLIFGT